MSGPRAIHLRGHHLVCLQFFHGEGYCEEFVANLDRVVQRATARRALIVSGIDDVCAACPELGPDNHCASEGAGGEDEIARLDALALEVLGASVGQRLSLAQARERLGADAVGVGMWRAHACEGCTWASVCESGWEAMLKDAERAARASRS